MKLAQVRLEAKSEEDLKAVIENFEAAFGDRISLGKPTQGWKKSGWLVYGHFALVEARDIPGATDIELAD